jgi:hypothetical protein
MIARVSSLVPFDAAILGHPFTDVSGTMGRMRLEIAFHLYVDGTRALRAWQDDLSERYCAHTGCLENSRSDETL